MRWLQKLRCYSGLLLEAMQEELSLSLCPHVILIPRGESHHRLEGTVFSDEFEFFCPSHAKEGAAPGFVDSMTQMARTAYWPDREVDDEEE